MSDPGGRQDYTMAEYVLVSTGTLYAAELRPNLADLQAAWDRRGGASGVLAALRESDTTVYDDDLGDAYINAVLDTKAQELRAQGHSVRTERTEELISNTVGWTRTPWTVLILTPEEYDRWEKGEWEPSDGDHADLDYRSEAAEAGLRAIDALVERIAAAMAAHPTGHTEVTTRTINQWL